MRPKSTVLRERAKGRHHVEEILATPADTIYVVAWRQHGQLIAINLRTRDLRRDCGGTYRRTAFPHPGFAHCLAARLSRNYGEEFVVVALRLDGRATVLTR